MNIRQSYTAVLIGLHFFCFSSLGAADNTEIDFEAKAGLEHDSNVNVKELDTVAGAADTAMLLNARVSGTYQATEKLKLKTAYSYASKAYREYDDFDQAIHTLSADASYNFALLTLGSSYHVADAKLASEPFLNLRQGSVYAGKLFDNRVYLRAALNRKEKTFDNNPGRDAEGSGVDADLFVFFNDGASFVSMGLVQESESAGSELFDNRALGVRGRLSNKFIVLGRDNTLQLALTYLRRDYSEFDLLIRDRRQDVHRGSEASWEIALTPFISAIGKLEYAQHQSNLQSADYNETLSSVMITARF